MPRRIDPRARRLRELANNAIFFYADDGWGSYGAGRNYLYPVGAMAYSSRAMQRVVGGDWILNFAPGAEWNAGKISVGLTFATIGTSTIPIAVTVKLSGLGSGSLAEVVLTSESVDLVPSGVSLAPVYQDLMPPPVIPSEVILYCLTIDRPALVGVNPNTLLIVSAHIEYIESG